MSAVESMMQGVQREARVKRARLFRRSFDIGPNTRILEIGSTNGSAIAAVLAGTRAQPNNVYIAGSNVEQIQQGQRNFGFVPVAIPESDPLPFEDQFFDIVYCSSVIEHATVPKEIVWSVESDDDFRERAKVRQQRFANEVRRLGKGYYVQTPNKWFPVESHTWLPFVGYLPRRLQLRIITLSNRYWIKRTDPDWWLLTDREMRQIFPDAEICRERFMGLTKSIMAIKA